MTSTSTEVAFRTEVLEEQGWPTLMSGEEQRESPGGLLGGGETCAGFCARKGVSQAGQEAMGTNKSPVWRAAGGCFVLWQETHDMLEKFSEGDICAALQFSNHWPPVATLIKKKIK